MSVDDIPDTPFTTVLADFDGECRWVGQFNNFDLNQSSDKNGIYLLVMLDPDGTMTVATKPGNGWEATWSAPFRMERR